MNEIDLKSLAQMTGLTTRTLRNYMKRGLLDGNLRNGKYFFTEAELERFLQQDFVKQGMEIRRNSIIHYYIQMSDKKTLSGCLIVDVPGKTAGELTRLQQKMVEKINREGYAGLQFSYHYDEKKKAARFIITGRLEDVRSVTEDIF